MSIAYLIDFSASTPDPIKHRMAEYVCRQFRPGDIVIGFNVWAAHLFFQGNPTVADILKSEKSFRGGTNPTEAIKLAKNKDMNCEIHILSDGEFGNVPGPYRLIKFE